MTKKPTKRPNKNANTSNMIRSVLFTLILICFGVYLITSMNYGGVQKTEVPISEVIQRANDPEGNIAKITVTGETLDITLKDNDKPTETSRKDSAGTLYDQGLINYCDGLAGNELTDCQGKYPTIEYKEDVIPTETIVSIAVELSFNKKTICQSQ